MQTVKYRIPARLGAIYDLIASGLAIIVSFIHLFIHWYQSDRHQYYLHMTSSYIIYPIAVCIPVIIFYKISFGCALALFLSTISVNPRKSSWSVSAWLYFQIIDLILTSILAIVFIKPAALVLVVFRVVLALIPVYFVFKYKQEL